MPVGTVGRHHASCAAAGIVYSGDLMMRSGWPYFVASCHTDSSGHRLGAGAASAATAGDAISSAPPTTSAALPRPCHTEPCVLTFIDRSLARNRVDFSTAVLSIL